jgi:hypothetical protein
VHQRYFEIDTRSSDRNIGEIFCTVGIDDLECVGPVRAPVLLHAGDLPQRQRGQGKVRVLPRRRVVLVKVPAAQAYLYEEHVNGHGENLRGWDRGVPIFVASGDATTSHADSPPGTWSANLS